MFFLARCPTPKPKVVVSLGVEHCSSASAIRPSNLPGSSDLSRSRKELYRVLVVGSISDPLVERLEEVCSQLNNSEFLFLAKKALLDCLHGGSGLEETALHAFYYCVWVRSFWSHVVEWMTRIDSKLFMRLNVGCVVDNVDPP